MSTVWAIINNQKVSDRLRELIDGGLLADANHYAFMLESFVSKMKAFVQANGGHLALALYDRIIMQLPLEIAEQLPDIVRDYQEQFNHRVAIGIGMTFQEAARAANKSVFSGQIELYDPNEDGDASLYDKAETPNGRVTEQFNLPPNLFDPLIPKPIEPEVKEDKNKIKASKKPDAQTELQAEASLLQGMMEAMGVQSPEEAQQQAQQQQDQDSGQGGPKDLLEALNGGPVDGHNPDANEVDKALSHAEKGGKEDQDSGDQSSKDDDSGDSDQPSQEEVEDEVDDAEKDAEKFNQNLAHTLSNIKTQIPQIMALAESNPKAFNQAMNMINKLITVAKKREKVSKTEMTECDDLQKSILGRIKENLPIGSVIARQKKVVVNGKPVWRSVVSGQVQDASGNAVSVRSSNLQAQNKGK